MTRTLGEHSAVLGLQAKGEREKQQDLTTADFTLLEARHTGLQSHEAQNCFREGGDRDWGSTGSSPWTQPFLEHSLRE